MQGDVSSQFDAPLLYNLECGPRLGDRVINLNSLGVPFGLKGTVITIHNATGYVEVVFDEEFVGGRALAGSCSQFRGRLCPWHGLLRVSKDEEAAAVGSTGLGTSSASKQQAPFQHANAKPKAAGAAPAPPVARDGHVMGMHPKPSKKAPAPGVVAPGTVQELVIINKGLAASNVAGPPVTFATAPPPEVKYKAAPVRVNRVEAEPAATADQEKKPKSILGLLKRQLQIAPPAAAATPFASSSSDEPLPRDVQASRVSSSMGGFRILRRAAEPNTPGAGVERGEVEEDEEEEEDGEEDAAEAILPPAPPARILEPVVPSDGTGRAALALAAGLEENRLPPLPEAPLEPPMAGVIQINTFAKPISKPSTNPNQSLKARGFFSSGGAASDLNQRPPSPLKRVLAGPPNPTVEVGKPSDSPEKPHATASVAEKLAFAKKMLLLRKLSKTAPSQTPEEGSAANTPDASVAAPTTKLELEEASAPAVPGTKLLVPMALLKKAAPVDKK